MGGKEPLSRRLRNGRWRIHQRTHSNRTFARTKTLIRFAFSSGADILNFAPTVTRDRALAG